MRRVESTAFDPVAMHAAMQRFSRRRFLEEMRGLLRRVRSDKVTK